MPKRLFRSFIIKILGYSILSISLTLLFTNCSNIPYIKHSFLKYLSVVNSIADDIHCPPKWSHEQSDILPDPALVFGKLPNGFRYILMKNHTPVDRVGMHLHVQAGSLNESDKQQGLAHFLEHLLFCGSKHFQPGELVKYFQQIGMQFGPDANARTGFNETIYDVLLPKGDRENLEKGLIVMQDYAEGALLLQSEIERERNVILAEKRTRDSASYRTLVSTLKFEFPEAMFSKRLPIGIEEVIEKADRKLLKDFYDTWYRPDNIVLVMVGDFDISLATSLIKKNFEKLSSRAPAASKPNIGNIDHKGLKVFYHFEKETGNTTVTIEVLKKITPEPDSSAFQKKDLIKNISDRIVQDRLDTLIGKPGTPYTSAVIGSGIHLKYVEYAQISADCSPENWKKTLTLLEKTLRAALCYGFTQSELERVKKDFLSELDNAVNSMATRSSRTLAREILYNLNNDRVFQSPEQQRNLFAPFINSLTLQQANESFRQTWAPNHRLVLVTGNVKIDAKATKPEALIRATYNKSRRQEVSKPIEKKSVKFPYLPDPGKSGRIIDKREISDLGILRIKFENGVYLNLKKTDFEADEVQVNIAFGNGRAEEPASKSGLAALTSEVMNESGLAALTRDEIDRALAGKNTSIKFDISEDRFLFEGKTVSKEIYLLFQLLYAHLVDPGYREDAYKLCMEKFKQKYSALSRSISGAMHLSGERFLAGNDSRFGLPVYEDFKTLTLEDIRSWIDPALKNDAFEVSIVGDFDMDSVIAAASKYFGSFPHRPVALSHKRKRAGSPIFPIGQSFEIAVPTEIPKALVVVAYPTEDFWDIHKTRCFSVLSEIFSDRLRESIREKLGAAYSPFSYNKSSRAYPGYGVLQAMIQVAPKETATVLKEVRNIISNLAEKGVTQEELRRAVKPMLTSIKEMLRLNAYWLDRVLTDSARYPQQLEWSRTIIKDYDSIAVDELSVVAKQYLDNHKAAQIVIKPMRE
ncbi:MAG: insulinase family protein [Desulfobacterales bacterium]|nr:insulinase family protein [Desulfobacterales bacterium]